MARRLTPQERALWSRVAATVRPLPGTRPVAAEPVTPNVQAVATAPAAKPAAPPAPPPRPAARKAATPVAAATLDGSWDRRLLRGEITPDRTIDLHGHNLAAAHQVLERALADSDGARVILIVTGKGRADRPGRIRAEFTHWLDSGSFRHRIAALRPAHPRHGGSGAFYLILRRRP